MKNHAAVPDESEAIWVQKRERLLPAALAEMLLNTLHSYSI